MDAGRKVKQYHADWNRGRAAQLRHARSPRRRARGARHRI